MARKLKPTRRVRIRLDFVVEMDRDLSYPPFGCKEAAAPAIDGMIAALKGCGIVALCAPWTVSVGLDQRPLVTTEERRIMRHALGLDRAKVAYRNRYSAPASSDVLRTVESLTARGFMERGDDTTFHVTPAGIEAVTLPREREKPETGAAS